MYFIILNSVLILILIINILLSLKIMILNDFSKLIKYLAMN